jgi:hypothetical protein
MRSNISLHDLETQFGLQRTLEDNFFSELKNWSNSIRFDKTIGDKK